MRLKSFFLSGILLLVIAGCKNGSTNNKTGTENTVSFAEARRNFTTKLTRQTGAKGPVPEPPAELFTIVQYPTPLGNMSAYLSVLPDDGKLHPAIVWITGGFGNDIGDVSWAEQDAENDQSGSAFWEAGIITMYPSQRGGNTNPGADETCFGEIDDINATAAFLARQKGVDLKRIYLGGHSTGGTKVLLAAECSKAYRAIFSFGAVARAADYGNENITFDQTNPREAELREPIRWLSSLQTPAYIFEGNGQGNIDALKEMEETAGEEKNTFTHFYAVKGKDHFSVLQPVTRIIAQQILADDKGGAVKMDYTAALQGLP